MPDFHTASSSGGHGHPTESLATWSTQKLRIAGEGSPWTLSQSASGTALGVLPFSMTWPDGLVYHAVQKYVVLVETLIAAAWGA